MSNRINLNEHDSLVMDAYRGSFYQVNKLVVARVGFMAAVLFEIILKWQERLGIPPSGKVYMLSSEIEKINALTYKQQYRLFNILEQHHLIKVHVDRKQKKKYVSVNMDVLGEILIEETDIKNEKIKEARKLRDTYKELGKLKNKGNG